MNTLGNWHLNAALEIANKQILFALTVGEMAEIISRHAEPLKVRIAALELQKSGELTEPAVTACPEEPVQFHIRYSELFGKLPEKDCPPPV